jgi:hypothetical protein
MEKFREKQVKHLREGDIIILSEQYGPVKYLAVDVRPCFIPEQAGLEIWFSEVEYKNGAWIETVTDIVGGSYPMIFRNGDEYVPVLD